MFIFIFDIVQMPHSMIADAHRQSVDVIAWHPAGHMTATSSHDSILKFWSRECPGSTYSPFVIPFLFYFFVDLFYLYVLDCFRLFSFHFYLYSN